RPTIRFLFIPWFAYQKRVQTTRLDLAGNWRTCSEKLLCILRLVLVLRGNGFPRRIATKCSEFVLLLSAALIVQDAHTDDESRRSNGLQSPFGHQRRCWHSPNY